MSRTCLRLLRHLLLRRGPARTIGLVSALELYILLLAAGLVAVVAYEWDWWVGSATLQTTDDAYLWADTTPLAAKVPGYVRQIPVRDFQTVKAVEAPGTFDILLPIHIGYDTIRQKIMDVIAAAPKGEMTIRDVEIYPSSGKIIVGRRAKTSDTDPNAGEWVYLSATPQVEADSQTLKLPDLAAASGAANDIGQMLGSTQFVDLIKQRVSVNYQAAYQRLIDSANQKLTRPLKNGFRMEGHLTSAKLDKVLLLADGFNVVLRASGDLGIVYGL